MYVNKSLSQKHLKVRNVFDFCATRGIWKFWKYGLNHTNDIFLTCLAKKSWKCENK